MAQSDRTLEEALAAHGISHQPGNANGKRRLIDRDGSVLGLFDAFEGWSLVGRLEAKAV